MKHTTKAIFATLTILFANSATAIEREPAANGPDANIIRICNCLEKGQDANCQPFSSTNGADGMGPQGAHAQGAPQQGPGR